jgi:hypothetical protein
LPDQAAGGHCLKCLLQLGLKSPAAEAQRPGDAPTEKPCDSIGPYKLLAQLGEGGCGIGYLAEQEQPIRRQVALKIIKLGMDNR